MRIGELADRAGLTPATVRYYERRGLLARPERTDAGYRAYTPEAVVQLRLVGWAKDVGFTLREIRDLLRLVAEHARRPDVRVRQRFEGKLRDVESRMQRLGAIREELRALAACRCRGDCPIIARAISAPPSRKRR